MITLPDKLKAIALSPSDQVFLAVRNGVRWAPPSMASLRAQEPTYERGKVKRIARAYVDGTYGQQPYGDVAAKEKIGAESLKQAIWVIRSGWKPKPYKRRTAA